MKKLENMKNITMWIAKPFLENGQPSIGRIMCSIVFSLMCGLWLAGKTLDPSMKEVFYALLVFIGGPKTVEVAGKAIVGAKSKLAELKKQADAAGAQETKLTTSQTQ